MAQVTQAPINSAELTGPDGPLEERGAAGLVGRLMSTLAWRKLSKPKVAITVSGARSAAEHVRRGDRAERRGFRDIRPGLGTPARVPKPSRPGPGRPQGSSKGPAPRYPLPAETRKNTKTGTPNGAEEKEKVKT